MTSAGAAGPLTGLGLTLALIGLPGLVASAGSDSEVLDRSAGATVQTDASGTSGPLAGGADEAIRRQVIDALRKDPHVNVADLEVEVQDGVITLYGRVATSAEKHLAARKADDVRGARGVVNVIDSTPGLRATVPPGDRPPGVEQQREVEPAGLEDGFRVGPEPSR